ncbi:MAG: phage baseplate protein [Aminipila sp.]
MDIFLSINNNEKVIQFPVLPSEFTLQSSEAHSSYQTISQGEITLIGNKSPKTISFSGVFPEKKLTYSKNTTMYGWDFVKQIEEMRDRKLPFRLIITETPINMPVTIESFEYGLRSGTKDIQYSLEFKEFKFMKVK